MSNVFEQRYGFLRSPDVDLTATESSQKMTQLWGDINIIFQWRHSMYFKWDGRNKEQHAVVE